MAGKVRIFIGCGSGIATSNMAKAKTASILERNGIPGEIVTGNVAEMSSLEGAYDVFLVTTISAAEMSKPVIPVVGLLSGINAGEVEAHIVEACKNVLEDRKG